MLKTMASRVETLESRLATPAVAPASGWKRLLADWAVVGGAETVGQVLGVVTSILLRMLLSPAQMGVWQALKVFLNYANYANLGVSKGAARDYAVALGRGDTAEAQRGLSLAHTVNTLSSLAFALALAGAAVWVGSTGGPWAGTWAVGLVLVGGMAVVQRYVTFQVTILRSKQAFWATSRVAVLEAVLTLTFCGLATWLWGLAGLFLGTLAVMGGSLVYVHLCGAPWLGWAWDAKAIGRLIAVGSPILLAGTVATLFRSLDKLMILAYLPDREFQLGCYSVALLVTTQLYGLGNMLSIVLGPRFGEKFGQTGSRPEVALLAARTTELLAAAASLPAGLALVAAPPLLAALLPDYQTGLAPLAWLVPGVVGLSLALPAGQYLIAVDQQGRALAAVIVATVLAAVGNHLALTAGCGLAGVAAATGMANAAFFVISARVSLWGELSALERLRFVLMLALAVAPVLGLALAIECLWPSAPGNWAGMAARMLTVTAAWGLSVALGWRYGGWGAMLRRRA